MYKVDFASIPWTEGREGVRFKIHRQGNRQLRLVEFATGNGDPHWCEEGHIGYVLEGGLEIEFPDATHEFRTGDGLFIPAGAAAAHRSVTIVPGTRLLMVEELT
jgi:quercetin dioxygenase-like cupin family protein